MGYSTSLPQMLNATISRRTWLNCDDSCRVSRLLLQPTVRTDERIEGHADPPDLIASRRTILQTQRSSGAKAAATRRRVRRNKAPRARQRVAATRFVSAANGTRTRGRKG